MPTSDPAQISQIIELITLTAPKKILDIGVGFGKYGFLSREYLELCDGREKYADWTRKIDGIEAFERYITPVHTFIYNQIFIGNAIDILQTLKEVYDLILLIDVFEHFDFNDGLKVLEECQKRSRNILISVPKDIEPQGGAFCNPYEKHKFQWEKFHFNRFTNKFFVSNIDEALIIYIGENTQDISQKIRIKKWLRIRKPMVRALEILRIKKAIKWLLCNTSVSK